jgi:O-acetyl-ADP-ribose deacetylase (regulator of RNase III)
MKLVETVGNLLNEKCTCIAHVVNCQGKMGSGLAKQIVERFPDACQPYFDKCNSFNGWDCLQVNRKNLLGQIILYRGLEQNICHMFAQEYYGNDNNRYLSYDAFVKCLEELRSSLELNYNTIISFPKNIGCGLAGGNWNIVKTIIEETFKYTGFEIRIVEMK